MDSDNPQFFIDENADLNDMTEEVHNQRLNDALARYWAAQAQEMVFIVYPHDMLPYRTC